MDDQSFPFVLILNNENNMHYNRHQSHSSSCGFAIKLDEISLRIIGLSLDVPNCTQSEFYVNKVVVPI